MLEQADGDSDSVTDDRKEDHERYERETCQPHGNRPGREARAGNPRRDQGADRNRHANERTTVNRTNADRDGESDQEKGEEERSGDLVDRHAVLELADDRDDERDSGTEREDQREEEHSFRPIARRHGPSEPGMG
jgi:hypothetical protein